MSLLWREAVQHEAMPWYQKGGHHPIVHSVRDAGFAGYTDDEDRLDEMHQYSDHDEDDHDDFDEDLHDATRPESTPEDRAHFEEHGEYPQSFHERHDDAYGRAYDQAKSKKRAEDKPDYHDPDLINFIANHGANTELWKKYGKYGPVSLKQPIHATQSHVSQTHIDRYTHNPGDLTDHQHTYGDNGPEYLGNDAPMFVTHHGAVHATEGHHRTAAALQRGDHSIHGWHYDLDEDPARVKDQEEVEQDGSWKDPAHWDEDDHEMYSGSH